MSANQDDGGRSRQHEQQRRPVLSYRTVNTSVSALRHQSAGDQKHLQMEAACSETRGRGGGVVDHPSSAEASFSSASCSSEVPRLRRPPEPLGLKRGEGATTGRRNASPELSSTTASNSTRRKASPPTTTSAAAAAAPPRIVPDRREEPKLGPQRSTTPCTQRGGGGVPVPRGGGGGGCSGFGSNLAAFRRSNSATTTFVRGAPGATHTTSVAASSTSTNVPKLSLVRMTGGFGVREAGSGLLRPPTAPVSNITAARVDDLQREVDRLVIDFEQRLHEERLQSLLAHEAKHRSQVENALLCDISSNAISFLSITCSTQFRANRFFKQQLRLEEEESKQRQILLEDEQSTRMETIVLVHRSRIENRSECDRLMRVKLESDERHTIEVRRLLTQLARREADLNAMRIVMTANNRSPRSGCGGGGSSLSSTFSHYIASRPAEIEQRGRAGGGGAISTLLNSTTSSRPPSPQPSQPAAQEHTSSLPSTSGASSSSSPLRALSPDEHEAILLQLKTATAAMEAAHKERDEIALKAEGYLKRIIEMEKEAMTMNHSRGGTREGKSSNEEEATEATSPPEPPRRQSAVPEPSAL